MKTTGNTVLITGAGTGMGLAAARAFTARGDQVLMVARDEERLRAEAAKLPGASPFACDITDEGQLDELLAWTKDTAPELNVVFLNAGVTHNYRLFQSRQAVEFARAEMETNFVSAVDLTHRFVPLIKRQQDPALIITTSGVIYGPDTTNPTYSATKAALHSYVQSMRWALAKTASPIRLFELIAPLVDTPFAAEVKSNSKASSEEVIEELMRGLESGTLEIRPGASQGLYEEWRRDPDHVVSVINENTEVTVTLGRRYRSSSIGEGGRSSRT